MVIQKIAQTINIKNKAYTSQNNKQVADENKQIQNPIESTSIDSKLLQKYYVSFGSLKKREKIDKAAILDANYTQDAQKLVTRAALIAKDYGHPEITEVHIEKAALESISEYIKELDDGVKTLDLEAPYQLPNFFASLTTPVVLKDKKEREKIKPVINEEIGNLGRMLEEIPSTRIRKEPVLSQKMVDGIYEIFSEIRSESGVEDIPIYDGSFLKSMYESTQNLAENNLRKFMIKFSETVMTDARKPEEKVHLSLFDEKAKNVLKNLSLGTNMFITHDKAVNPMYLVDSIVDVLENQNLEFGNLNKNNTKITILNDNVKEDFFMHKVRELAKDKNTNHIIIVDEDEMLINSPKLVALEDGSTKQVAALGEGFLDFMKESPKNIKLVLIEDKGAYYNNMSDIGMQKIFENFGEIPLPVLSMEQAKKAFREQPLLMHKIDVPFSRQAIDRVIEASALLEGAYPEKAQKILKKMASYYIGKKEVNEKDVKTYMEEAKDLFKLTSADSSVEVVFDTGKNLKDILGKEATQKEAAAIVKQIKTGTLGTKGKMIYSQDGSVGSGRKFIAKAIAGETKSPYVELNALDFASPEVDIFGGGVESPEHAMKKVFALVKTQAEASPNKSAVILIENFERLVFGDGFSPGYAKAMAQLPREMDNATKKGLNILVLGSTRDPMYAEECSENALDFIDKIEVESPANNINARKEILTSLIKKSGLKIAGETEADKNAAIKLMAETADGFPFVYLVNLVNKMKTVAFERGHKQIEKGDVTEAYLQLTTGRPASGPISQHRKDIVTTHEWGHGIDEEYMWSLANKQNVPWHLGDRVNFITLDPRGVFGGAMYGKDGGNEEQSFEKMFSNLVCDFGGHSTEKHFYNIDGSYGITGDMEMATASAEQAVGIMGQGHNFGKKSLYGMNLPLSQKSLEVYECDRDALLENARLTSDLIIKAHTTMGKEFTQKYSKFVGTGDCLIQGDTFRQEIADWISKQSKEKLAEMEALDETILKIVEAAKNGIKFDINGENVLPEIKNLYKSVAHYIK